MKAFTFNHFGSCSNPEVVHEYIHPEAEIKILSAMYQGGNWGWGYSLKGKCFWESRPIRLTECTYRQKVEAVVDAIHTAQKRLWKIKRQLTLPNVVWNQFVEWKASYQKPSLETAPDNTPSSAPKIIKAISLKDYGENHNNYATLVEQGRKQIETRTWSTKYRGDILICCSKSSKSENAGLAVCVVELVHIEEMLPEHEEAACIEPYENAKSWMLTNHRKLSRKFPVKGALSLYDVEVPEDVVFIPTGLWKDEGEAPKPVEVDNQPLPQLDGQYSMF